MRENLGMQAGWEQEGAEADGTDESSLRVRVERKFPAIDRNHERGFFSIFGGSKKAEFQPFRGGIDTANDSPTCRLLPEQGPWFKGPAQMPRHSGNRFFRQNGESELEMRCKPFAREAESRCLEVVENLIEILFQKKRE